MDIIHVRLQTLLTLNNNILDWKRIAANGILSERTGKYGAC